LYLDLLTSISLDMRRIDPALKNQARVNRRNMNAAETRLWWDLRRRGLDARFRRQHVFLGYILDFACVDLKLNVELDGSQHFESQDDRIRDRNLGRAGWTVIRFQSRQVFSENEMVVNTIGSAVEHLRSGQSWP
jgi:very-short-patch-repair endonuclease